jgi:hypothetical protein
MCPSHGLAPLVFGIKCKQTYRLFAAKSENPKPGARTRDPNNCLPVPPKFPQWSTKAGPTGRQRNEDVTSDTRSDLQKRNLNRRGEPWSRSYYDI